MTRNYKFIVYGVHPKGKKKSKKDDILVLRYFDTEDLATNEMLEFANNSELIDTLFEYKTIRMQIEEAVHNTYEIVRLEVCTPNRRTKSSKH